jgi:rRNA-processing protein FCF1
MNRQFNPSSNLTRCAFAAVAVLVNIVIAAAIEGLIDHYRGDAQVVASQPVVMAQR